MGAKADRMEKFRQEHPVCYYCATAATETEDHVPARIFFADKVGPEGFAFPACKLCNGATSKIEQVVALYVRMADHGPTRIDVKQFHNHVLGVANNNPDLLPRADHTANQRRQLAKEMGLGLVPGQTYAELPMLELPPGNRAAFELFARKLFCGLYYRERGEPLPLDQKIASAWTPSTDANAQNFIAEAESMLPGLTIGSRRNTNIGKQFAYRCGWEPSIGAFGILAQFGGSYLFFGASVRDGVSEHPNWKPHRNDVPWVAD